MDPDIDFRELSDQFDTLIMGRQTYEAAASTGPSLWSGLKVVVFSKTLSARDHPGLTIGADPIEQTVAALRVQPGKDIWLFGGAQLFRAMAHAGLVDTVELAVIPSFWELVFRFILRRPAKGNWPSPATRCIRPGSSRCNMR